MEHANKKMPHTSKSTETQPLNRLKNNNLIKNKW